MRIIRFHGVCCTLNEMKPKFNIFQKTSFAVTTNNHWTEMTSRIICREMAKYVISAADTTSSVNQSDFFGTCSFLHFMSVCSKQVS